MINSIRNYFSSFCCNFTTALFPIFQRKHRDVWLESNRPVCSSSPVASDQPTMTSFTTTKTKVYADSDPRRQKITDAVVDFIAGDLQPVSLVESTNFRALLQTLDPCYTLPSRRTFTSTLLRKKADALNTALKSQLQQATAVCLTIDLWSNRQMRGFLGITGHYILDWSLHSVMLACTRFCGSHTADNIAQRVDETLTCFDITDRITHIITDNAANMLKAFDLFPGSDGDISAESDSDDDDSLESVDITDDTTTQHDSCFAHTLQLVVKVQ